MSLRLAALAAALAVPASAQLVPGEPYAGSVVCGDVAVDLVANTPEVPAPTLFVEDAAIPLPKGPSYAGPVCVVRDGVPHAGFTEFMGNAYEAYRLVDLRTLAVTEITYAEAETLGWWD